MTLIKVKPWGKGQGDFVQIDEGDFDKDKHELYQEPKKRQPRKKKAEDAPK